ncbi:class I SAM-dependent methyltransferase [bacterium]|nr:MAG: class I SAM-dependent methyltransferase [bacterium]
MQSIQAAMPKKGRMALQSVDGDVPPDVFDRRLADLEALVPVWSANFAAPLLAAVARDLDAGLVPGAAHVLDVGTGAGYPALELAARHPGLKVEAIDPWQAAVARARARGVAAFHGDLLTWEGGPYDAIVANVCLNVIPDRAGAALALARLLRPGGRLYATVALRGILRELDRAAARICGARQVLEQVQEQRLTVMTLREAFAGAAFSQLVVEVGHFPLCFESGTAMAGSVPIRLGFADLYRQLLGEDGWQRLIAVLDREHGIAFDVPFALLTATRAS